MTDLTALGHDFLTALTSRDPQAYERVLSEGVGARIARWDHGELHRPRSRVVRRLMDEWSAWSDALLEPLNVLAAGDSIALEFRIQATEDGHYVEHLRSAFLKVRDGKIDTIDLYCPQPIPSARRKHWVAPKTMAPEELERLLDSLFYSFDVREWIPPNMGAQMSTRIGFGGSDDPHPGSNWVGGAHWTAEEADTRIEELITHFRKRGVGFNWMVSASDTPADLRERLERHGLILAGDQAVMARIGLDNLDDIAVNSDLTVELVDGTNEDVIEAGLQIRGICFNWTPEQIKERRKGTLERMHDPRTYETEVFYLGRLNGKPVADGHLELKCGLAYLGGACTLPEYRHQRIYSTLLRRRLEDARARGYHISAIHAEPMSRPIVSRYGFKEYARSYMYGWMPVIDRDVIKSLVPDE